MEPRVVLQIDVRLRATFPIPLRATNPVLQFFEKVLRGAGFLANEWFESKDYDLYVELSIPAAEVNTVVRHVTNLSAPNGYSYSVNRWTYNPEDNTYRAWHDYAWQYKSVLEWANGREDFEAACERYLQEKFVAKGFSKKYPMREPKEPYRTEPIRQSA